MSKYKITLNGKAYEIEVEEISESEAKSASTAKAPAAAPVAKAVPAAAPAAAGGCASGLRPDAAFPDRRNGWAQRTGPGRFRQHDGPFRR